MKLLTVMTFNVRQADADDGGQSWPHRKDALVETIRLHQPSLLGTQETFAEQTDYILAAMPHYLSFGRGRFGDHRDKHNKVFYDRRLFSLVDTGEIWISKTPDVPGSSDWDIPSPRMITWGTLQMSDGPEFFVMNTHFPYGRGGEEARRQTARLAIEKLATIPKGTPVLFTGDFNAPAGGEIYNLLTEHLHDSWTSAELTAGPESTVHAYGSIAGRRIDWILHQNLGRPVRTETVTYTANGIYPSDHYPVYSSFDLLD